MRKIIISNSFKNIGTKCEKVGFKKNVQLTIKPLMGPLMMQIL